MRFTPSATALARCLAVVLAGACAPGLALGREPPARNAAAFEAVLDCRNLEDNTRRLACFDAAAAGMDEAQTRGDIVVIDRAMATEAHREAFGLPLPSLDFITRAIAPRDVDRVEGVVRSLRADPSGRWTFALEDGAVWRQIDGILMRPPHAGSKVAIRKAALGSFIMNVDGQAAVKVHRDR